MSRTISRLIAAAFAIAALTVGTTGHADVLKLAHDQKPDQGYGPGVAKFVEILKQKVGNKVEVQLFDNGVLGNERDVTEGLTIGSQEMCVTTFGVLTNYEPQLAVMNLPFIFSDWKQVNATLTTGVMNEPFARLEQNKKFKALGVYALGFRNVGSNVAPLTSLDSFKGLKIRVPQAPLFIDTFKALGANPTPIPWGELYTAMQTKVVDAFENSSPVVEQFKLNEVTKYLSKTGHIWEGGVLLISASKFNSLPKDVQDALVSAGQESAKYQRGLIEKQDTEVEAKLSTAGMKVNTLDVKPLQDKVAPLYKQFADKNNAAALVEKVKNAK
ncbi:TRAP transporter substrate-binding protein [Xanthobacteraceae bacterium Astr-EGSB]|uniref:TRAP transporter substrate-binding protein n=1 Tax=Astrobacterium formosum TaxID=3069710 RepID=UPI0027B1FEBA|nr:TRAP transporter substrate-binding protein [Xanthobacteraceae bacterium Astr-EGSB]